jgi:hypothetical protein
MAGNRDRRHIAAVSCISAPGIGLDEGHSTGVFPTAVRAQFPKQFNYSDSPECVTPHRAPLVTFITWNRGCSAAHRQLQPQGRNHPASGGSAPRKPRPPDGEDANPVVVMGST